MTHVLIQVCTCSSVCCVCILVWTFTQLVTLLTPCSDVDVVLLLFEAVDILDPPVDDL